MKFIITFGKNHVHKIKGKIFDCDCVAEVEAENENDARNLFMPKFCHSYPADKFEEADMEFYPRGKIPIRSN